MTFGELKAGDKFRLANAPKFCSVGNYVYTKLSKMIKFTSEGNVANVVSPSWVLASFDDDTEVEKV